MKRMLVVTTLAALIATGGAPPASSNPQVAGSEATRNGSLTSAQRTLIDRPDQKRAKDRFSVPVLGRPLSFGGRYTFRIKGEKDRLSRFNFSNPAGEATRGRVPENDRLRIKQTLQLDLFYPFSRNIVLFLSGRGTSKETLIDDHFKKVSTLRVARGETWLYLGELFDTPFGLQVGRQAISDERQWWWDENLDAVRVHFDLPHFHAEAAVSQELFPVSTRFNVVDPNEKNLLRVQGAMGWEWARKQRLGLYVLHQDDSSSPLPSGACIRNLPPNIQPSPFFTAGCIDLNREDESDADLTWFGFSATGRRKLWGRGVLHYAMSAAGVVGDEVFHDVSGPTGERRVIAVDSHHVRGWGVDARGTWQTKLPMRPRLTLGYAFGSGHSGSQIERDRGFRQTGLQDDNGKFLGIDGFQYYGELFDPELSNLHIVTTALGFRLLENSSVELVYHYYSQVKAAPFLRDVGFKRRPDGSHRDLGHEWDVIVGVEEWDPFEIELIGAVFRTGKAFAPAQKDLSFLSMLQVRLNF